MSDGAAVMLGSKNGVGKKFESVNPKIIVIRCICHRLALVCASYKGLSSQVTSKLKYVEKCFLYLTELWKLLTYSNQKMAVFVKTQVSLANVNLLPSLRKNCKVVLKHIAKAISTRWLSNNSVQSAKINYIAIIQTLMKLSMTDPTSSGLLTHMNSSKFLATLFILSEILPITGEVSKLFKADVVSYSSIEPGLTFIKQKLEDINTSQSPTKAYNEFVGSESVAELLNFDVEKTASLPITLPLV